MILSSCSQPFLSNNFIFPTIKGSTKKVFGCKINPPWSRIKCYQTSDLVRLIQSLRGGVRVCSLPAATNEPSG